MRHLFLFLAISTGVLWIEVTPVHARCRKWQPRFEAFQEKVARAEIEFRNGQLRLDEGTYLVGAFYQSELREGLENSSNDAIAEDGARITENLQQLEEMAICGEISPQEYFARVKSRLQPEEVRATRHCRFK